MALIAVASTLDDDVNDATDAPTLALMVPTVPRVDVTNAPTMASMMTMLLTMQSTNQAILNRLDAAINLKAALYEIARLDDQLDTMAQTVRDDVTNAISAQLALVTDSITDLKANLSHITKTHTKRLDQLDDAIRLDRLDFLLVSLHSCEALEQHLTSPTNPPGTTVVDPSL